MVKLKLAADGQKKRRATSKVFATGAGVFLKWTKPYLVAALLVVASLITIPMLLSRFDFGWGDLWPDSFRIQSQGPKTATFEILERILVPDDFSCQVAGTSIYEASGTDPGWVFGPLKTPAVMRFEVVGKYDFCIDAEDQAVKYDAQTNVVTVDVLAVRVNRPALDMNPYEYEGMVYQTLFLQGEKWSVETYGARYIEEAVHNWAAVVLGVLPGEPPITPNSFAADLQARMLYAAQIELNNSPCFDVALGAVEEGVRSRYLDEAESFGRFNVTVTVNMPSRVEMPILSSEDLSVYEEDDFVFSSDRGICEAVTWGNSPNPVAPATG